MQGAGDQFLSCSCLAVNQRGPHMRRQPPDRVEQLLHLRAAADQPVELEGTRRLSVGSQQGATSRDTAPNGGEDVVQTSEIKRFAEVIECTQLHSLDGRIPRRVTGHQDHLTRRGDVVNGSQHVQPADVGHAQINNHGIRFVPGEVREGRAAVGARYGVESDALREAGRRSM